MERLASDEVAKPAPMIIAATRPSTSQGNRLFAKKVRKGLFSDMSFNLRDRGDLPGDGFTELHRRRLLALPLLVAIGSKEALMTWTRLTYR